MKKILLPMCAFAFAFSVISANAGEMTGKVVAKKGDEVHIQQKGSTSSPTSLKVKPDTKVFKKEAKKSPMDEVMVDEFVEVIYSIDPKTKEPVIDEIIVLDVVE